MKLKRVAAWLMAVLICLTSVPAGVFAEDIPYESLSARLRGQ